jgi:hypothetical protein
MALKRLSSEEMIHASSTWIDTKSKAHKAILASPELTHFLPRLSATHAALATAAQPGTDDPRQSAISAEEDTIDARHDDIIRGTYMLLTGAGYLLGMSGAGAPMVTLRDALIPDGLSSVQKTYRAEAGQAAQLSDRLTPDKKAEVEAILVGPKGHKKTLAGFVEEWIGLGKQLGALEDEKGRLQATAAADPGTAGGAALLKARNQWVRVVNALVANGELAELDSDTDALIFGPLRAAEKLADRRAAKPAQAEPAAGAPAPGGTAAPPAAGGSGGKP